MSRRILLLITLIFLGFVLAYSDSGLESVKEKDKIPERISVSLDALLKTKTSNGIYSISYFDSYFYVLQKSVYVNVLFTADLSEKFKTLRDEVKKKFKEELEKYKKYINEKKKQVKAENIKIIEQNKKLSDPEKKSELKKFKMPKAPVYREPANFFILYLRIVRDGKIVQRFKSFVPYKGESDTEYFSFGIIATPGKYSVLVDIDAYDHSEDGTMIAEITVPEMTLEDIIRPSGKLTFSKPRFYRSINSLPQAEKRFTVIRNGYQIGVMRQIFHPYIQKENNFKSGTIPLLTFFCRNAEMKNGWDLKAWLKIEKGKTKIADFKPITLNNPYFFQPVKLIDGKGKALPAGNYKLNIIIKDKKGSGKGSIKIPFRISD